MTKLDSLIAELCPGGVECRALGDCCIVEDNKRKPIKASERTKGDTPYYGANNIQDYVDGFTHDGEYVLIAEDGSSDLEKYSIQYVTGQFWANNHVHVVTGKDVLETRYLFHYLSAFNFIPYLVGGTRAKLNKSEMLKVSIALPPLSIQCEIVRILDNFTELTAELTAELTTRKKQYEFYRNELLTFVDDVPIIALSHCCSSISDGDHQAPPKTDGGIPFITISNITSDNQIDFSNTRFVPEAYYNGLDDKRKARTNDILYTVVGSFGIPVYINSDIAFTFQRHIAIIRPNSEIIISKYLYHALQSCDFLKQTEIVAVGAAQRTITLTALNKMRIPLPSLDEQARIADILDRFDALTADISNGLPAEIAARQKQYEYYRDKLLSFKEVHHATS